MNTYDYKFVNGEVYEFPKLYTTTSAGKKRVWAVYVRLIKKASKQSYMDANWNMMGEIQVPIKLEYFTEDIPSGILSQMWTESGLVDGEITRSAPTYPEGKAGRNCFIQALSMANSKYVKKRKEGGVEYNEKVIIPKYPMYFPMLAHEFDPLKEFKGTVYVQPKLDGNRCLAYLNPKGKRLTAMTIDNVILYSRNRIESPHNEVNDAMREELLPILVHFFRNDESLYLDGELYNHNMKLQTINHHVRGREGDDFVEYWIYDAFYPSEDLMFKDRLYLLREIQYSTLIRPTPTQMVRNINSLNELYIQYLKDGYEGAMIKNPNGLYLRSATTKTGLRSYDILKKKETFTDEFELVDFKEGNAGKEKGAVIWICITKEKKQFYVQPKGMTFVERRRLYKECLTDFENKYANRLLTVEYKGLSEDNIPLHAKGLSFRDID